MIRLEACCGNLALFGACDGRSASVAIYEQVFN
jgi:hypothetical protein